VKPVLEARDVQLRLPQRFPVLLVDRILEIVQGRRIVGLKNFTVNEPFFQGHFPENPIVPGTVLLEAMAQVGGIFVAESEPESAGKIIYLAGLDEVRFRRPVLPGDQVIFELDLLRRRKDVWKVKGIARVENRLVMEAVMLAAVRAPGTRQEEA
jgi:beta-hydroxyacyl-ACP dehydratase FabZ